MPDPDDLNDAKSQAATSLAAPLERNATPTDADSPPAAVARAVTMVGTTSLLIGGVYLGAWLVGAAPAWAAAGVLTMKTNMALALVLASATLLLLNGRSASRRRRSVSIVAAAIALLIGVLSLAQHLFQVDLGIDQLIATEPPGAPATVSPNRIGPPGSVSLALLGAGLLALAWRRRIAAYLGLATCLIVLVPAIGLLYGIGTFYRAQLTGIAWPTVIALFSLASGLMLAASRAGIVLWRNDPGGVLLRRLALPTVLIPLVLGYLKMQGERRGFYDTGTGTGLFALSLILVFSMLLWRSATQLSTTAANVKRAADELQEREERLRLFVEHAPAAVAMFDRDMNYVAASRRFLSDYGIASHHLEGRSHYDVFPEIPERWREIHRRCLGGAVEKCDEEVFPRADGTIDWVRWEIHPWRTASGEIGGLVLFSEVTTDRKRSESALRESEERHRSLFEHMSEGLAYCRMLYEGDHPFDFVYLQVNPAFEALTGLKGVEGKRVSEVIPGVLESDPGLIERYARVARSGTPERFEVYVESQRNWFDISAYSPAEGDFVAAFRVITDRKRAEEELRRSEQRLRLAQEAARIGSFEWDIQSDVNTWTPELEAIYGLPRGGFQGTEAAWESLVHPDDRAEAQRRVRQAFETGAPTEGEWRAVWPDGSVHWIAGRWQVLKDASGTPLRMTGLNMDITERKKAEGLRASEAASRAQRDHEAAAERAVREASEGWASQLERFNEQLTLRAVAAQEASEREARARGEAERREQELEALFGSMRDVVLVYGEDGRIQRTNEAATEFFGSDLRGLTMAELIQRFEIRSLEGGVAGALVPEDRLPGKRASRGEVVTGARMRVRVPSGVRILLVSASPLYREASGRSALTVLRDVTDFERAAESARRAAEQLRLAHDAIFVWQFHGGIESWNRGAEDLYGFVSDEVRGRSPQHVLQTRSPGPWADVERELHLRRRWEGELVQTTQDGRTVIVSAKLQLIRHDDGVERVVEVNRDITDRKRAEDALRESEQQLREADRRKDEFLAVLSHELRNPLAPIRNSLYVLDRAAPGGEQARHAKDVIERQVSQLTRLVADLLDVSRISRGKVQLQRERIDLREVVQRTLEDHRSVYVARGLELRDERPGRAVWVDGDAARIAQVLTNLLHNAAKFTKAGGTVTVTLRQERAMAVLQVRDTGAGIAPDLLARMFEPFIQGEQSLARAAGGLGLGLALVKGIVGLHGGMVAAHSDGIGKGAVFTLRIPAEARPAPAARPTLRLLEPQARRVLVIEDNVDAAESLKEVLEFQEHEVAVAFSGPEGLEKAHTFMPDLVLCDIGLPGMDGYEVARAIRADDQLKDIPLVAMTGYALAEDQRKAAAAGFDRHLAKPADFASLERILAELQGRRAG